MQKANEDRKGQSVIMAQVLIPVSGRVQLKRRGLLDPTWLHRTPADPAGYGIFLLTLYPDWTGTVNDA